MKRIRRILCDALTVLSLVLFLAALVLWVRSYGGSDYLQRITPDGATAYSVSHRTTGVQWTLGQLRLTRGRPWMTNDAVNALATAAGSLAGSLLAPRDQDDAHRGLGYPP